MEKNDRLKKAFEYLRSRGEVHTQADLAERMSASRANVSSAFGGNDRCLTNKFLLRFNNAFGNRFNDDWLLYGEGDMLRKTTVTQIGDNNNNQQGNNNSYNNASIIDKAFDEISEMRKLLADAIQNNKEQANKFFSIIERMK